MSETAYARLWSILADAWQQQALLGLSLTGPTSQAADGIRKYQLRPVLLGDQPALQWTAIDARKRQTHVNRSWDQSLALLQQLFGQDFLSAHVKTITTEYQVRVLSSGRLQIKPTPIKSTPRPNHVAGTAAVPTAATAPFADAGGDTSIFAAHNRTRPYLFPEGKPSPFLVATGIMTETGQVKQAMYRKFRQINRFAEFVDDLKRHFPTDRPLRMVDYGCGKSYLTFAVQALLVEKLGLQVDILGLDTNPEVIAACEQTRTQLGLTDVRFEVARIADAPLTAPLDLAIWLHACDTATDEAIARSVELKAGLILAVPCCQHELFRQVESAPFRPIFRHGILRERFAALATDALRAQLLEAHGYKTQVMEFIDLEHTAKNLLLRAVRTDMPQETRQAAWDEYLQMKTELHVTQFTLETLLGPPMFFGR